MSQANALPSCEGDLSEWSGCEGTYAWPTDQVGGWVDGKWVGKGIGDIYVGEWKNGKTHGKGTMTYANGENEKYVGEWKNGKRNGNGTNTYASGEKYVGEWKDGKRNGNGTNTFANGEKYVGEYKDDEFHGKGTYTFANGEKYVGEWKDDKRNGYVTNTYTDGSAYVGYVKDSNLHGQGVFTFPNGDKYEGQFKNDQYHGKGTYTYYSSGAKHSGKWVGTPIRSTLISSDASAYEIYSRQTFSFASSSSGFSELKDQYETYFVIKKCNETHILYVNPDELRQAKKSIRAIDDSYKSKGVDTDAVYKDAESNPSEGTKKMMNAMDIFFISGYNTDADAYCKLYLKALKKPEKPKGIKDF